MWQKKQIQLPDSRVADGVVLVNPSTGVPYTTEDGEAGVRVTTGTGAQTGAWSAIQVLEDATFTTLTETGAAGDAMTGFVVPAGVVLKGAFTAYTLASGKVRAYV